MLKRVLDNLDGLAEDIAKLYKKGDDGKFYLQLDGEDDPAKLKAKLAEFRDNNIEYRKQLEAMEKKYSGVDIDKWNEMQAELQKAKEKQLLDEGKVEELFKERTEAMRKDYETQLGAYQKKTVELETNLKDRTEHLSKILIDNALTASVMKVGTLQKGAMQHVLNLGRSVWRLEGNDPVARNVEGKVIYGKDPQKAISMDEWAADLLVEHPYLFQGVEGSQTHGSRTVQGTNKMTTKEFMDLPPQERLRRLHENDGK